MTVSPCVPALSGMNQRGRVGCVILSARALLDSEHSSLDPIHLTELVFQPQAIARAPPLKRNELTWSQCSGYHLPKWGSHTLTCVFHTPTLLYPSAQA